MSSHPSFGELIEMVRSITPPLTHSKHKGQAGRTGIIGGCREYTGAPYYAAISSLRVGGDLANIFCTDDAATPIKTYSPEMIVLPYLNEPDAVSKISAVFPRLHTLVIGPGLGRDSSILQNAAGIIEEAKKQNMPFVVDADGLFLVTETPDIVQSYPRAILTPNKVEFKRIYEKMIGEEPDTDNPVSSLKTLCQQMGNITIVQKGENDIISDGNNVLVCDLEGSARRCGGQGDLLAGSMGVFNYWAHQAQATSNNQSLKTYGPTICAAYAACLLTRRCNNLAFSKFGRSTITSDMIGQIHEAFEGLFQ